MVTKRDIITAALNEVGISSYSFDIQPEQLTSALGQMDRMVASWSIQGPSFQYLQGSPDIDTPIIAPDWAHDALVLCLAVRLGPSYGRGSSPETKQAATAALNAVRARVMVATMPEVRVDNMAIPAGAGHRGTGDHGKFLIPADELMPVSENLVFVIN